MKRRGVLSMKRIRVLAVILCIVLSAAFLYGCGGSGAKYKISFDSNGGSFVAPIVYTSGETLRMPSKPTRYGYEFDGWTYSDGTLFDAANPKISSDIKLKALWSIGEYVLTLDTDDLVEVQPITARYGAPIELPMLPDMGGSSFEGWYYADLTTPFEYTTMPGEDMTVYAVWKIGMTAATGTPRINEKGKYYTVSKRTLGAYTDYTMDEGCYSLEIDFTSVKGVTGSNFGLIFKLTEPETESYWESGIGLSYYYFHIAIATGGIQLAKVQGDASPVYRGLTSIVLENNLTDWRDTYASANKAVFTVYYKDGEIRCYINGELQILYNDPQPLSGNKIGLRAVGTGIEFSSIPTLSKELPADNNPINMVVGAVGVSDDEKYTTMNPTTWFDFKDYELSKDVGASGTVSADIMPNGAKVSLVAFAKQADSFTTFNDRFFGIAGYFNSSNAGTTIARMQPGNTNWTNEVVTTDPIEDIPLTGVFRIRLDYRVNADGSCAVTFTMSQNDTVLRTAVHTFTAEQFASMGTKVAIRVTDGSGVEVTNVTVQ